MNYELWNMYFFCVFCRYIEVLDAELYLEELYYLGSPARFAAVVSSVPTSMPVRLDAKVLRLYLSRYGYTTSTTSL